MHSQSLAQAVVSGAVRSSSGDIAVAQANARKQWAWLSGRLGPTLGMNIVAVPPSPAPGVLATTSSDQHPSFDATPAAAAAAAAGLDKLALDLLFYGTDVGNFHGSSTGRYRFPLVPQATPELANVCVQALYEGTHEERTRVRKVLSHDRRLQWAVSMLKLFPAVEAPSDVVFWTEDGVPRGVNTALNSLAHWKSAAPGVRLLLRRAAGRPGGNAAPGDVWITIRPELSGQTILGHGLAYALFGPSSAPWVELGRWRSRLSSPTMPGGGKPGVEAQAGDHVLIEQAVCGPTLAELLHTSGGVEFVEGGAASVLALEKQSLSQNILLAMLLMPDDAGPERYVCEEVSGGRRRLVCTSYGRLFSPASVPARTPLQTSPTRCVLFCLDQMRAPVHRDVRAALIGSGANPSGGMDVLARVASWLRSGRDRAERHHAGVIPQAAFECGVGVTVGRITVRKICEKLRRMQALLVADANTSHLRLLEEVEPLLGVKYGPAIRSQMSGVLERYNAIVAADNNAAASSARALATAAASSAMVGEVPAVAKQPRADASDASPTLGSNPSLGGEVPAYPQSPSGAQYRPERSVILHGQDANPEANGAVATAQRSTRIPGLWRVGIEGTICSICDRTVPLQPSPIAACNARDLAEDLRGAVVRVHGLYSQPSIDGHVGLATRFFPETAEWRVAFGGDSGGKAVRRKVARVPARNLVHDPSTHFSVDEIAGALCQVPADHDLGQLPSRPLSPDSKTGEKHTTEDVPAPAPMFAKPDSRPRVGGVSFGSGGGLNGTDAGYVNRWLPPDSGTRMMWEALDEVTTLYRDAGAQWLAPPGDRGIGLRMEAPVGSPSDIVERILARCSFRADSGVNSAATAGSPMTSSLVSNVSAGSGLLGTVEPVLAGMVSRRLEVAIADAAAADSVSALCGAHPHPLTAFAETEIVRKCSKCGLRARQTSYRCRQCKSFELCLRCFAAGSSVLGSKNDVRSADTLSTEWLWEVLRQGRGCIRRIRLRGLPGIAGRDLIPLLGTSMVELRLVGCPELDLSPEVLATLCSECRGLRSLIIVDNSRISRFSGPLKASVTESSAVVTGPSEGLLAFPSLRVLGLVGCPNLSHLILRFDADFRAGDGGRVRVGRCPKLLRSRVHVQGTVFLSAIIHALSAIIADPEPTPTETDLGLCSVFAALAMFPIRIAPDLILRFAFLQ